MKSVRMERLSQTVLLVLFQPELEAEGSAQTSSSHLQVLDVHLKPEALHFGLTVEPDASKAASGYSKRLRGDNGQELAGGEPIGVPFRQGPFERVLDVGEFVELLADWSATSAGLALQLAEGVEKVRFYVRG